MGNSKDGSVRLDLFYTDPFIRPQEQFDTIRMVAVEYIAATKMDVVSRGGRKKDFWDLHMLRDKYFVEQLLSLYQERYPYGATEEECMAGLMNFTVPIQRPIQYLCSVKFSY